jgi:surface antigen
MHKIKQWGVVTLTAAALLVTGCETRNENAGTVVGGVLGGVLGSQVGKGSGRDVAMVAGALAGALIGGSVGRSMDEQDRMRAQRTLETSRTGETVAWRNPDNASTYEMTPTRTYTGDAGRPCREFTMDAWVDGRKETVTGTACRQSDGTWKTM